MIRTLCALAMCFFTVVSGCSYVNDRDGDGFYCAEGLKGSYLYDCNDESAQTTSGLAYYLDLDGDGLGDARKACYFCPGEYRPLEADDPGSIPASVDTMVPGPEHVMCEVGLTYVRNDRDCDDADGLGLPTSYFYRDNDHDGLGDPDPEVAARTCPAAEQMPPVGYVSNPCDCDDRNAAPPSEPGEAWGGQATIYYLELETETDSSFLSVFFSCVDPGEPHKSLPCACNEYFELLNDAPAP